jgi:uncharacterized protein
MVKLMTTTISGVKKHRFERLLTAMLISLTVISCVTINIIFPAASAEKVAEQIVDDVLNSNAPKSIEEKTSDNDQSLRENNSNYFNQSLLTVINFVIPVAQASQANISIDSAKIRSIRKNMGNRQSKLLKYYQSGAIGFTNNGLIASVSNAGLSLKDKATVNKLINAENKDRLNLYQEIANANGHPEWQSDIQKTFSKTWINKISSGWMYQSNSGQWQKK